MPWKNIRDPYKIWLSEIILQQTRVAQGSAYYQKFILKYPDVLALGAAREEDVYKLWEGLGYYSRCKNLIHTAKYISNTLHGEFPKTYEDILALKGVGAYTAAAIASFAYKLPHAVVDGNVVRILSRFFGIYEQYETAAQKFLYQNKANELLPKATPDVYNQAIMDLGATVCTPKNPKCDACLLQKKCFAYQNGKVQELPVKKTRLQKLQVQFVYAVLVCGQKLLIRKRTKKDIWQNLHEFLELDILLPDVTEQTVVTELAHQYGLKNCTVKNISAIQKQILTHRKVEAVFVLVTVKHTKQIMGYDWVALAQFDRYAFPRFAANYINAQLIKNKI